MNEIKETLPIQFENLNAASSSKNETIEVNASDVSNAVLKRLIKEVEIEKENNVNAYNRLHNRHNRTR